MKREEFDVHQSDDGSWTAFEPSGIRRLELKYIYSERLK